MYIVIWQRRGFTLVELLISSLIVSMIALILMVVFRSNVSSWKWGQERMNFNQKIQLAMKQVFTDIKRINPIVTIDSSDNIWFKGEKIGDLFPNLVTIYNTDKIRDNGGEEIVFYHTTFRDVAQRRHIRIFLEKDALFREVTDHNGTKKREVISQKVSELHFKKNDADINEVAVEMTIADDKNPLLKENLSFAVHLDTDLVCVTMKDKDT